MASPMASPMAGHPPPRFQNCDNMSRVQICGRACEVQRRDESNFELLSIIRYAFESNNEKCHRVRGWKSDGVRYSVPAAGSVLRLTWRREGLLSAVPAPWGGVWVFASGRTKKKIKEQNENG